MKNELLTLNKVLSHPKNFRWNFALYMKDSDAWHEDAICAVLDPEDSEEPGDIPPELAKEHGLRYVLDMQSVQSIVSNAAQQVANPPMQTLVEAFNHYVEFDAFKDLT